MVWTNKGKAHVLKVAFSGETPPTGYYLALVTTGVAPVADTNTLSELTEIATGNGYTEGGLYIERNAVYWDYAAENDTDDRGEIQLKDMVWTGVGGSLPTGGDGAAYAVLTNDYPTVTGRSVYAAWNLSGELSVTSGNTLTLQNCELRIS